MNNKGITLLELTITSVIVTMVIFVSVSMYKSTYKLIEVTNTESTMDDLDYTLSAKIHRFKRSLDLQNYDSNYTYHIIRYKEGDATYNYVNDPQGIRDDSDIAKVGYEFHGDDAPKTKKLSLLGYFEAVVDIARRMFPDKEKIKWKHLIKAAKKANDPSSEYYLFDPVIIPGTDIFLDTTTLKIDKKIEDDKWQAEYLISRCFPKASYQTAVGGLSTVKEIAEVNRRPYLQVNPSNKKKYLVKCCPQGELYPTCTDYNDYAPAIFYATIYEGVETITRSPNDEEINFAYGAAFNVLLQSSIAEEAQEDPYIIRFAIMDNECSRREILEGRDLNCNLEDDKGRFLTAESPMVIYDPGDGGLQ